MEKFDPEKRLEARWCFDSETGEKFLIDMVSGQILLRGKDLKDMAFGNNETRMLEDAKMWEQGFNEGYEKAFHESDYVFAQLESELAWVREERDYLLKLSKPNENTIQ
jgi:hypothetical protein